MQVQGSKGLKGLVRRVLNCVMERRREMPCQRLRLSFVGKGRAEIPRSGYGRWRDSHEMQAKDNKEKRSWKWKWRA